MVNQDAEYPDLFLVQIRHHYHSFGFWFFDGKPIHHPHIYFRSSPQTLLSLSHYANRNTVILKRWSLPSRRLPNFITSSQSLNPPQNHNMRFATRQSLSTIQPASAPSHSPQPTTQTQRPPRIFKRRNALTGPDSAIIRFREAMGYSNTTPTTNTSAPVTGLAVQSGEVIGR